MRRRCGKRILVGTVLLTILCFGAVSFSTSDAADNDQTAPEIPPPSAVVLELQHPDAIKTFELPPEVLKRTRRADAFGKIPYADLKQYYTGLLNLFAELYPPATFSLKIEEFMQSYTGEKRIEVPEVHQLPFVPITLEALDENWLRLERLEASAGGRIIPGLRLTTKISARHRLLPPDVLHLVYIPDLNARILGFTHAQVISQLSKNVRPAAFFDYNAPREWSTHPRQKRWDQMLRPIELTNFAHSNGGIYTISALPDFALELPNFTRDEIEVTFFLWNSAKHAQLTAGNPDFIYQVKFAAPL